MTSFLDLSLELRIQIYDSIITEGKHDGDAWFNFENDVLQGPPIMKLLLACKKTHAEVLDVMFGDYRLCLKDTEKPHRFILGALLRQMKAIDRRRVKRVCLANFTLQGLVSDINCPSYLDATYRYGIGHPRYPRVESDYIRSKMFNVHIHEELLALKSCTELSSSDRYKRECALRSRITKDDKAEPGFLESFITDFKSTSTMLPVAFPALESLGIEFDVWECLPPTEFKQPWETATLDIEERCGMSRRHLTSFNPLMTLFDSLRATTWITQVKVYFLWHDRLQKRRQEAGIGCKGLEHMRDTFQERLMITIKERLQRPGLDIRRGSSLDVHKRGKGPRPLPWMQVSHTSGT